MKMSRAATDDDESVCLSADELAARLFIYLIFFDYCLEAKGLFAREGRTLEARATVLHP